MKKLALDNHLTDADALIIIPPFAGIDRPSIGAHILQACCKRDNIIIKILYANLLLAQEIGLKEYESICYAPSTGLLGERFFSKAAYSVDAVENYPSPENAGQIRTSRNTDLTGGLKNYKLFSEKAIKWIDELTYLISRKNYPVVGCSSTFEQTSASIALLNELKSKNSSIITIIGGANCEEKMAYGISLLTDSIDYIFSGECEVAFPQFMKNFMNKELPEENIINGLSCLDLDDIPTPNYSDFYSQFNDLTKESQYIPELWLPYESSRGCWWGQKRQCLFCGCNGDGLLYREKSDSKVIDDLNKLMENHPTKNICMVDNIMPLSYFKTLLPRLEKAKNKYHFFYEQKSNLSLSKVEQLKKAGVGVIQPGIESLSSPLLKLMNKGVSAKQNINLLRYCKMVNLSVNWNILHSFPNDRLSWYLDTLTIIESIAHLHPPTGVYALSIDRFSPYFDNPKTYGLSKIKPLYSYEEIFPKTCDTNAIAYHFEAEYLSESKQDQKVIEEIEECVEKWRLKWSDESQQTPLLHINKINNDLFLMIDTRDDDRGKIIRFLNENQAKMCLLGGDFPYEKHLIEWALSNKYCIEIDNMFMPLATTTLQLYKEMNAIKNEHNQPINADGKDICGLSV